MQEAKPKLFEELRDWRTPVTNLSNVGKLVHLAARMDVVDLEAIRGELLRQRRRIYEEELTIQAVRAGCKGKQARLINGAILSELNEMCVRDATSIVATFNYDLAHAIARIRSEVPTANRYIYAHRLNAWQATRGKWKNKQIALYTETSTRSKAQSDFFDLNADIMGVAILEPRTAVCPVCEGWITRGEVPLFIAKEDPPPYHVNCPHLWRTIPDKIGKEACADLWLGQ